MLNDNFVTFPSSYLNAFTVMHDQNSMEVSEDSPLTLLTNQVPSIVKAIHRLLKVGSLQNTELSKDIEVLHLFVKDKSVKTRQGCFSLLSELVSVLPGALANHISAVIPGIQGRNQIGFG